MNELEQAAALWEAGKQAPYALYEAQRFIDGVPILVEAMGGNAIPIIRAGDVIPPVLAARVRLQLLPPPAPAVSVEVVKRDADGNAVTIDGVVQTELVDVPADAEISPLSSHSRFHVDAAADNCCDMCGKPAELFQIGHGWYCKTPRVPDGSEEAKTCYDLRLAQLGVQ